MVIYDQFNVKCSCVYIWAKDKILLISHDQPLLFSSMRKVLLQGWIESLKLGFSHCLLRARPLNIYPPNVGRMWHGQFNFGCPYIYILIKDNNCPVLATTVTLVLVTILLQWKNCYHMISILGTKLPLLLRKEERERRGRSWFFFSSYTAAKLYSNGVCSNWPTTLNHNCHIN